MAIGGVTVSSISTNSALASASGTGSTGSASGGNAFEGLSSADFMEIILTELANQDPNSPNDTQALLSQLSTLYGIQSDTDMINQLGDLVDQSEFASAASMIGAYIGGRTATGQVVEGAVISVSKSREGPVLNLDDGSRVPLDRLDEVTFGGLLDDPRRDDVNNDTDDDDDTGDDTGDDDTGDDTGGDDTGDDDDQQNGGT